MKKFILIASALFLVIGTTTVQAQKPFKKAIITYTISYDGTWDAATLAQQPNEQKVKVMGKKSKTEIISPGAEVATINNGYDSSMIILLDVPSMGWKYYMKTPKDKILEKMAEDKQPEIKYTEETKEIAGFTCKKAEYITEDEYGDKITTIVWYNETVGGPEMNFGGNFSGLKGFPMEYTIETEEGKITYTVTVVQTKKVKFSDTDFLIPTDYEELTEEKAKELFGGDE